MKAANRFLGRATGGRYTVYVDDNFHHMDESERYLLGHFDSEAEAEAAARSVVDRSLQDLYRPGMSAGDLMALYRGFGEDPWISPQTHFSAWAYAEARCQVLCGPAAQL